jgi:hypothetical protein
VSDTQFYVLVTVLGGGLSLVGAAIRFSVGRVVAALDLNSKAMLENTASNATLSAKIDGVAAFVRERESTPIEGVPITGGQYMKVRKNTEGR